MDYSVNRETLKVHILPTCNSFEVSSYRLFVIYSANNRKNYQLSQINGLLVIYINVAYFLKDV